MSCLCGMTHDDEDPRRKFYVSVIDGDRWNFLVGPYETHEAAMADVEEVRALAESKDQWAHFYDFGTARAPLGYEKPGALSLELAAARALRTRTEPEEERRAGAPD